VFRGADRDGLAANRRWGHRGSRGRARSGSREATYGVWRKCYGQLAIVEIGDCQLEEEHRRLKQLVADLTVDKVILQEVLAKKA
jgi:putative transposase